MIKKEVELSDIKGIVFRTDDGSMARVQVDEKGVFCDVEAPDVELRILMKPIEANGDAWTAWHFRQNDTVPRYR